MNNPVPLISSPSGDGNLPETVTNLESLVRAVDKMDIPALAHVHGNIPPGTTTEPGEEGPPGQPGPQGPTGPQGPAGQIIYLPSEDGEDRPPTPPAANIKLEIFNWLYPVGSIYTSTLATNPGTLLGIGTWTAFAAGRVLVGIDAAQTEFDTVEETGGAKTHTLTTAEMPSHAHEIDFTYANNTTVTGASLRVNDIEGVTGGSGTAGAANIDSTGGGGAHNNLQPYVVVYMWKRTA